jgi:hypothetical protein
MRKFVLALGAFLSFQGLLFYASLSPVSPGYSKFVSGYAVHFAAFFLTTLFLSIVLSHRFIKFKYPVVAAVAYSVFVSVMVEFLQRWMTSYRTFDYLDMAFGIAGAVSYAVVEKIVVYFFG